VLQTPCEHTRPTVQACPHAPQFAALALMSAHRPSQGMKPGWHCALEGLVMESPDEPLEQAEPASNTNTRPTGR
jgi:hypothetical protein